MFQAPDLSKTVEVSDNGTIDLPLLGETPAAGKTAQELQRDLNRGLARSPSESAIDGTGQRIQQ